MKKKFEDNVAITTIRSKTEEPSLPWKVDETDLAGIETREGGYEALSAGDVPFKTRPIFLVLLVVAIFFAAFYMVAVMAGENELVKLGISAKEKEAAELQINIDKISAEKTVLEKSSEQLEKRIGDLGAQKELLIAVLESMAKKDITAEIAGDTVTEPAQEVISTGGENAANIQ